MNDRFTEKARNAIEKARAAAMELGHSYIGTEHLLLGIVRETDALGSRVLRENGFEEDLVMDLIEKAAGRGAPGMPVQGLTPRCRRVIEIAVAEANRLRHSYVGTEHLLMGILREPESTAAHLLTAAGGDLNKIYTDVFTRFTSSDYRALRYMQMNHPDAELMLITGKPCNDETIDFSKAVGIKRLSCTMDGTSRKAVKKAHKEGLTVILWPGQSVEDFMLGAYLGCDLMCTDVPIRVKNWLAENAPYIKVKY